MAKLPNLASASLSSSTDCQRSSSRTQRRRNANAEPWVCLIVARDPVALLTLGVVVEERRAHRSHVDAAPGHGRCAASCLLPRGPVALAKLKKEQDVWGRRKAKM